MTNFDWIESESDKVLHHYYKGGRGKLGHVSLKAQLLKKAPGCYPLNLCKFEFFTLLVYPLEFVSKKLSVLYGKKSVEMYWG